MKSLYVMAFFSWTVAAQGPTVPSVSKLNLDQYLEQVKTQSPEGRQLTENVFSAELRLDEADTLFSPEAYGEYRVYDSRTEPPMPFQAPRTKGHGWQVGVRDQTTFGLGADVFVTNAFTALEGVDRTFFPNPEYYQPSVGLELRQSLWRNGFGEASRADLRTQKSQSRMNLYRQRFALKNLLLRAKNTYWSLVSFDQIVKLQEENVDRARKLSSWMSNRARLKLFDDVDAMQAQASLESRELELQSSLDERAVLLRQFNTLRAAPTEDTALLSDLPSHDELIKNTVQQKRMTREDFQQIYEEAEFQRNQAIAARSKVRPQVDLIGRITSNGLDREYGRAMDEVEDGGHPAWQVGVSVSFGLDFSLLSKMRRAFDAQKRATEDVKRQAQLNEERFWDDVLKQRLEAKSRYERALRLEQLQTKLVQREQQRLRNGRTTTFQAISAEQNLALSQIQRVKAQLALLQLHNVIQSFDGVTSGEQL